MRTRLAPLAFVALAIAAAVPLLLRCGEQAGEPGDGADAANKQVPMEYKLSGLRHVPIPCDEVADHIPAEAQDLTGPIEISLDRSGDSLVVDPRVWVLARGGQLQWTSDSLIWAVAFTEGQSPVGVREEPFRGNGPATKARPVPSGPDAVVPEDADCGRYYYLVAAHHPDTPGRIYIADPPGYVR